VGAGAVLVPDGLATNLRTVRVQAPAAFAVWGPEEIAPHFPQLEIQSVLGRGGMGVVYKARQPELDRLVALKVLVPDASPDPAFSERFLREARALARLNHPHIVTVHEIGRQSELCYLIMELVDGVSLRSMLQSRQLEIPALLELVIQVCKALQYAHDEGVVHRDVKPDNILVDRRGGAKIVDFGIAKLAGRTPHEVDLRHSRQVMGTLFYMAPEQFEKPHAVDQRADIYSLGVVLYEAVTGELPLGRFDAPVQKAAIDLRLNRVILQALEKQPERRYQRVADLQTDLEACLQPIPAEPLVLKHTTTELPAPPQLPATGPEQIVRVPAYAFLIVGVMTCLGLLLITLLALAFGVAELLGGTTGLVARKVQDHWTWLVGSLPGPLMLAAGRRLLKLQSRAFILALACASAITTLLAPSPFNLLNFPIAIWVLITVLRSDVRKAFRREPELDPWERWLAVCSTVCLALLACVMGVFLTR
jgi:hypothetical protein